MKIKNFFQTTILLYIGKKSYFCNLKIWSLFFDLLFFSQKIAKHNMNRFLQQSIDFANQSNYLDELFRVYPTIPNGIRDINKKLWTNIEKSFNSKNNKDLINNLLDLELFPIKDSYVAYLKRDRTSIDRNPNTINRICGEIYEMGLDKVFASCSQPKETNRQIGPMFKCWIRNKCLGIKPVDYETFISNDDNAILDGSDAEMKKFAYNNLNYSRNKGLDFLARFNKKYIIGEAKFLSDFGGHQNAQFEDAIATISTKGLNKNTIPIAILDGVCYIKSKNKMHCTLTSKLKDLNIMSALVLREFLYQI